MLNDKNISALDKQIYNLKYSETYCNFVLILKYTGCAKKKDILNIYVKSQIINIFFLKIRLLTHNYIYGRKLKYQVCILNIH